MTDNELIAKFMGAEFQRKPDSFDPDRYHETWIFKGSPHNWRDKETKYHYTWPMLCYHTDWDWLMPVADRINKTPIMSQTFGDPIELRNVRGLRITSTIDVVYEAVIRFIKWYKLNEGRHERS